ncbi:MAG: hypothetical protein PCFJNLEI_00612 [Verrucomicrobiae bacterium]|nr:hypothetical protein [Verrucomicrobiae bacterium]
MDSDLTLTSIQEERAAKLHRDSVVIDVHADVHLEVLRRRGRGETQVMRRLYYDWWREAGLGAVGLTTMAKFGPEPYPYSTSPARNFLLMTDAIAGEIAEKPRGLVARGHDDATIRGKPGELPASY